MGFHRQSSFEIVHEKDAKGDDAFHFVGYIGHEGKVYELDGLKSGPILIGDGPAGQGWADRAREEVQRRIETYSKKAAEGAQEESMELRFNLMAIVADPLREAQKKIERERFLRQRANVSLISRGEDVELQDEVDDDDAPADILSFDELSGKDAADVKALVAQCTSTIESQTAIVTEEQKKRDKWARENALRRADLVPLALCAMRHLARKGQLMPALEKGKAEHLKRVEEKKAAAAK